MKAETGKLLMVGLGLVLALSFVPSVKAGECEYGKVEAWARTLEEDGEWGEWQNATVHETLKVHEPFQVRVTVTTKVDIPWMGVWLERAGTTHVYEMVEGPAPIGLRERIPSEDVTSGTVKNYIWTLHPTGNWTEGTGALNICTQFTTMEDDKKVDFTIIAAYIEPQEWQGTAPKETGERGPSAEEGSTEKVANGIGSENKKNQGDKGEKVESLPWIWIGSGIGALVIIIIFIFLFLKK